MTLAAVVAPAPRLDPTLDRELLALAEELAARLGQAVPRDDVVVFGLLLALADVLVGGDAELSHRFATGEAAHLRVSGESPGQEDLVHGPRSPCRSADGDRADPACPAGVDAAGCWRARLGGLVEGAPAPAVGPSGGAAGHRWSTDRRRSVDEAG